MSLFVYSIHVHVYFRVIIQMGYIFLNSYTLLQIQVVYTGSILTMYLPQPEGIEFDPW